MHCRLIVLERLLSTSRGLGTSTYSFTHTSAYINSFTLWYKHLTLAVKVVNSSSRGYSVFYFSSTVSVRFVSYICKIFVSMFSNTKIPTSGLLIGRDPEIMRFTKVYYPFFILAKCTHASPCRTLVFKPCYQTLFLKLLS